jgi:hypothetical protein
MKVGGGGGCEEGRKGGRVRLSSLTARWDAHLENRGCARAPLLRAAPPAERVGDSSVRSNASS